VNLFTVGVWALSIWVGICASVYFDARNIPVCYQDDFALEHLCSYTPEFSVLWYPFVTPNPISAWGLVFLAYSVVVFGYLGAPLFETTARQVAQRGRALVAAARANGWRF
jgi:hypothetical protein